MTTAPALLFRLRPSGPWRPGSETGARHQVDPVYHSDTLFSALASAMARFGWLDEWIEAAAAHPDLPQVRLSSLFPFTDSHLLAPAPGHLWPPPGVSKLYAAGARFIPLPVVAALAAGRPFAEDDWETGGASQCLLRRSKRNAAPGPFRFALRTRAAVDRVNQASIHPHQTACIEFTPGAGLWCVVQFASDEALAAWRCRIESAFRLLADTGLGGERTSGWGRFAIESVESGTIPDLLFGPAPARPTNGNAADPAPEPETGWWLLSLFSPAPSEPIDWSRGCYEVLVRGGRIESPAGWGVSKKTSRMIREGSVLLAPSPPLGSAPDVAPAGFPHPVYRAGFALSIPLPWRVNP